MIVNQMVNRKMSRLAFVLMVVLGTIVLPVGFVRWLSEDLIAADPSHTDGLFADENMVDVAGVSTKEMLEAARKASITLVEIVIPCGKVVRLQSTANRSTERHTVDRWQLRLVLRQRQVLSRYQVPDEAFTLRYNGLEGAGNREEACRPSRSRGHCLRRKGGVCRHIFRERYSNRLPYSQIPFNRFGGVFRVI